MKEFNNDWWSRDFSSEVYGQCTVTVVCDVSIQHQYRIFAYPCGRMILMLLVVKKKISFLEKGGVLKKNIFTNGVSHGSLGSFVYQSRQKLQLNK